MLCWKEKLKVRVYSVGDGPIPEIADISSMIQKLSR
jgi:hypothetical protein